MKKAGMRILSSFQCLKAWRSYKRYRLVCKSTTIIQSHLRGFFSRGEAAREQDYVNVIQVSINQPFIDEIIMRVHLAFGRPLILVLPIRNQ